MDCMDIYQAAFDGKDRQAALRVSGVNIADIGNLVYYLYQQ